MSKPKEQTETVTPKGGTFTQNTALVTTEQPDPAPTTGAKRKYTRQPRTEKPSRVKDLQAKLREARTVDRICIKIELLSEWGLMEVEAAIIDRRQKLEDHATGVRA